MSPHDSKGRPAPDPALTDMADYVYGHEITSLEAYRMARCCLLDSLGCAMASLNFPECTKLLGPVVPGIVFHQGAKVPGTQYQLDPVTAAFNISTMIRWLDFNDGFTAAQGGHPSDNIGGLLATEGTDAVGGTPEEFRDYIAMELAKWDKLGRAIGLRTDQQKQP